MPAFPRLPLAGREAELTMLRELLARAEAGQGATLFLCGESGVGKSRLLRAAADEAAGRGWSVVAGRAYPVESGVPYALFSDALLPLLRRLSPEALGALTRGGEAELARLFPPLPLPHPAPRPAADDPAELRIRLLWNFTQFLGRLAARQPLLLLLEDLQWADASSLELLHFTARQIGGERIAILCSYSEGAREQSPTLRETERSLVALDAARVHRLAPLSRAATAALIREAFGADEAATREFSALLYGWTRGNPFFLEEALKWLVQSDRLRLRDGAWTGWEVEEIGLPGSIRDAVLARLAHLSAPARGVADLLAVLGTGTGYEALRALCGLPEAELVGAIDELRALRIVDEEAGEEPGDAAGTDSLVCRFTHPVLREALYADLGQARARLLHARVATGLEALHGDAAPAHADALAYHFARARSRELAPRAVRYLEAAGRAALARHANREAADYLGQALERARESGLAVPAELPWELARARQRLGEFDAATELWDEVRAAAEQEGDHARAAEARRRTGLALYWSGRYPQALDQLAAGLESARRAGDERLGARLRIARGGCFQEMGRPEEARRELDEALRAAAGLGDRPLLARVHMSLLLLHTWTGPPERAWSHGRAAEELAAAPGDAGLSCTVHWGLAVLAGLTGDAAATRRHLAEGERLAELLRSPLHRLRVAELAIEFMANTGDWDAAAALAERTLAAARALRQRSLLARLLVWTAMLHLGRGDLERGGRYVDEAWQLSGADEGGPLDVHSAVPAHCGRAAHHVAAGDFAEALRVGEAGLAIADRSGYTVWAIHRLLPVMAEAALSRGDVESAERIGGRLRRDSTRLGHPLGLAWADACDAFLVWLRGDIAGGIERLREAAERLEAIPVVPDAARLRRHLAARLRDHGRREEALRELRGVHEVFLRLGAERELQKTREQIRELGARPPVREAAAGAAGLSPREVEIVRLVAQGKSNKTIARALDVSPRTVSTHLSNIFRKLEVGSRAELASVAHREGL